MTKLGIAVLLVVLPAACEQTLRTGRVGNTTNAPSPDGTCPAGQTVCGKGPFAQCLDLQNDRAHCGSCDNSCVLGIPCAAGTCQQVACTGPVTVSTQSPAGSTVTTSEGEIVGALLADINGDGRPDLVTWRNDTNTEWAAGHGTFQVALGVAGGSFGTASTYQASIYVATIVAGDSNADGFQDLYILNEMFRDPCVEIWLGHADGWLTSKGTGMNACLGGIATGDLNGDGKVDLVTAGMDAEPVVYLADANGDYHVGTSYPQGHGALTIVRDWNGDGSPDLIALGATLGVSLNKGNGTFEHEVDCGVVASYKTVLGDFNRDGHVDVADMMGNNVTVLLGMGGCQFQPMMEYPLAERVDALSSGDVNGDGLPDLVAKTDDGKISLLLGGPEGAFQVVPFSVGGAPGYEEYGRLLVGDVTGDGKADVVFVPGVSGSTQIFVTGDGGSVLVSGSTASATQILENTCP